MMAKKTIAIGALAMLAVFARGGSAEAAEGGSSHYLPGVIGEVLFAVPPQPGFLVANTVWFQSGDLSKAVLEGQVDLGLDLDIALNLVTAAYRGRTLSLDEVNHFGAVADALAFTIAQMARIDAAYGAAFPEAG
jgi:hypothetical protein